jgi:AcrR family transcriptional regulator
MELTKRQLQIVEAAGKLLSNGGVQNLTTKRLAVEMGFSEAALYRHFKSKDEIIFAMLNFLAANIDDRFNELINSKISSTHKIKLLFDNQFVFFNENKHYLVAIFSDGLWENNKKIHQAVQHIMLIKQKHLNSIFKQGQNKNEIISHIKVETLTNILMGTFRLHMLKWKMSDFKFDLIKTGNQLVDDFIVLVKT